MSLRLRLTLIIVTVVAVTGVVGSISFYINHRIQRQVAQLSSMSLVGVDAASVKGQTLEITGYWDEQGLFIATEIEKLSRSRRPKLRGEIARIDSQKETLSLFGLTITIDDETEFLYTEGDANPVDRLKPGVRVEVSCKIEKDGAWTARKIRTRGIKKSDKVKGIITRADLNAGAKHRLEINGLVVTVDRGMAMSDPKSPLYLMQNATQLTVSLRECLAATYKLLEETQRARALEESSDTEAADKARLLVDDAEGNVVDAYEDFVQHLSESRSAVVEAMRAATDDGSTEPADAGKDKIALWLDPLEERRGAFEDGISEFVKLAATDPDRAREFLVTALAPLLENDILPIVQAYHLQTEEDLSDRLLAISSRSNTAARLAIATNIVGLILALVLGIVVARSISRPVLALKKAAEQIGRGNLDIRVDIRSGDEIGVLASAFNRMAEELTASTVSVNNLNNVIDSMAGALFILAPDETIRSVNRAALGLLGYEESDLVGKSFSIVCPTSKSGGRAVEPSDSGIVPVVEKTFRRKDGATLPVSFSGTALRDRKAAPRESGRGSIRGFVCVAQDLTDHKRMEDELRESLSEKELLLREVHHRVKNNLQVISSLLDLQARTLSDPRSEEKFQESQDRIRSMVLIHEQLYRTRDLEKIDFQTYLEQLSSNLTQSYGVLSDKIRLSVEVEAMDLDIDRALACGLIVNELVTNAFKHGFANGADGVARDGRSGKIVISSRLTDDGECVLEVSDNGRGLGEGFKLEESESLGMSLVTTLVQQVHGRLRLVNRDGETVFRVAFPMKIFEEVA